MCHRQKTFSCIKRYVAQMMEKHFKNRQIKIYIALNDEKNLYNISKERLKGVA